MYFLVALFLTVVSGCLAYFLRSKKVLHLEILAITYGAATLMWFIDCCAEAAQGEPFIAFEIPLDIWISLWTFLGGLAFWGVIVLVRYFMDKNKEQN